MAAVRLLVCHGYGRQVMWPVLRRRRDWRPCAQLTVWRAVAVRRPVEGEHGVRAVVLGGVREREEEEEEEDPFAELKVREIAEQVGGIRVRQHVNPLKASLMAPLAAPRWEDVFADPTLPLAVDVGCGSGRFLMMLARRNREAQNFLGLDVRQKLVDRSKLWARELNLCSNVHFMVANATVNLAGILASYPSSVTHISVLCPDPHFKQKHRKRRIVQKSLVDAIVKHLAPWGQVFVQSDVKEVAEDMRHQFDEFLGTALCRDPTLAYQDGWLSENPVGIPSEREVYALSEGGTMYRLLYRKL